MGTNDTADRIAHIALTILEKEGPEAVSMHRVAEAVRITPWPSIITSHRVKRC